MDVATLGFGIDSSGALRAANDLDRMTGAAGKATTAQDGLEKATARTGGSLDKIVTAIAGVTAAQDRGNTIAQQQIAVFRELVQQNQSLIAAANSAKAPVAALGNELRVVSQQATQTAKATDEVARANRADKATVDALTTSVRQQAAAQTAVVVPMNRTGGAMKNLGMVSTQLGFQIQDFAVQVASGQSALIAFAQQAPQAAGAFSLLGGKFGQLIPWVGTFIAIGAAVAPLLMNMGEKAKTAEERVDDLRGAMDAYRSASEAAGMSTADMIAKYGDLASTIRTVLVDQMQIAAGDARKALDDAMIGVSDGFQNALGKINLSDGLMSGEQAIRQSDGFRYLREELELAAPAARILAVGLNDLKNADGPREQALAAIELRDRMIEAYGSFDKMPAAAQAVYRQLEPIATTAGELAKSMFDSRDGALALSSVDMATGIQSAAAQALTMAGAIHASLVSAQGLAGLALKPREDFRLGPTDGSYGNAPGMDFFGKPAANSPLAPTNSPRPQRPDFAATERWLYGDLPKKGGGGGAKKSEAQRDSERLQKELESAAEGFYKATRTPLEEYAQTVQQLNDLKAGGFFNDENGGMETFNRAMTQAQKDLADAKGGILDVGDSASEMFTGMMTDAANAKDYFVGFVSTMLNQVLSKMTDPSAKVLGNAASNFLSGLLPGMGGASGGSTSPVPSMDGGGYTGNSSRTGGLDGKGGFWAIMHPRETVTDHTKGQSLPGGGQQNVHVTFGVDGNGNLTPFVRKTAGGMDAQVARAQQRALPQQQADNQRRRIA